jgi:hypothetical protein
MEKENNIHKAQINFTVRRDKDNNVIDKNVMINVRTNEVSEAVSVYNSLRKQLNGELDFNPAEQAEINQTESGKTCPNCGRTLVRRKAKNGDTFLGCIGYPNCRHTQTL